jgi:hypothetical protein
VTTDPTEWNVYKWIDRVNVAKQIADPVAQREAFQNLLEEYEAAQSWVQEMERDMDFFRKEIFRRLNNLDKIMRGEKVDD